MTADVAFSQKVNKTIKLHPTRWLKILQIFIFVFWTDF